jgi:nucleoside diphosphate kinase
MATNRTFTMIKPDAVANGHIGNILAMITNRFQNRFLEINTINYC